MSRLEKIRQNKTKNSEPSLVYSRTEQEKSEFNYRRPVALIAIVLLLAGLIYLLFFSNIFNITKIEVNGYQDESKVKELVAEQLGGGWFGANIFLFNVSSVTDALKGNTLVSDVSVRKVYPNKIIIEITESKPSLVWVTGGDKYLIDERGDVIGLLSDQNSKLPVVYDSSGIKVSRGDRVASPTFIVFIQKAWQSFESATGVSISKIIIFDLINDVHILSSAGWTVYMDASKDPDKELENLTKVLRVAQASSAKLEYIDLRLGDKAYYK